MSFDTMQRIQTLQRQRLLLALLAGALILAGCDGGGANEAETGTVQGQVTADVGNGRLIYTTFHNETGATADQEVVLRYFIYLPA